MRLSSFGALSALVFFGCGRTEQKVELKNQLLEEVGDPNCKKGACPDISYKLVDGSGVDASTKVFEGVVNTSIDWTIKVQSTAPAGRIKIAPVEWPGWMVRKDGLSPGSMIITGKPENVVASNTVKILARDISRCVALEKETKKCADRNIALPQYDKTFTLKFSVKAGL